MQLYTDLKNAAAKAEAVAVDMHLKAEQISARVDVLKADLQKEESSLAAAEAEAAEIRAAAAAARAEGRAPPSGRKLPDLSAMRESVGTTKDAIGVVQRQLRDLRPGLDHAEQEAREAADRLARFERGAFLIEVGLLFSEIFARNQGGVDEISRPLLSRSISEALKNPKPNGEAILHRGLEVLFGIGSLEAQAVREFASLIELPDTTRGTLPTLGNPGSVVLEALAVAPRATPTEISSASEPPRVAKLVSTRVSKISVG